MSKAGHIAAALFSILSLAGCAEGRAGAREPMTLEALRQRVARNEELIDPIKLSYTVKFSRTGEQPRPSGMRRGPGRPLSHVNIIWAQSRSKQYLERHAFYGPNEPAGGELTVLEGRTRTQTDLPDKRQAWVELADSKAWYDIPTAKLRVRPFEDRCLLSEVLVPGCAVLHRDPQTLDNRVAYIVDVARWDQDACLRLWIDAEAGIPLRTCVYDQHPTRPQAHPIIEVNDITPYRLPNGGWIPVRGVRAFYYRGSPPHRSYEHIVVDVNSITTQMPDTLFQVELPAGAGIYNDISGLTTVQGQSLKPYEQVIREAGEFVGGTVTDPDGKPIPGVAVTAFGIQVRQPDGATKGRHFRIDERVCAVTDGRGRFALDVKTPGSYALEFYSPDFVDHNVHAVPLGEHDLRITLEKGGTVAGRLFSTVDGKKTPLAGVEVAVQSALTSGMRNSRTRATTDEEGRFEIWALPTQIRDRAIAPSELPRYIPLSWRISCGSGSQDITFDHDGDRREVELVLKPDARMAASLVGRPMPELDGLGLSVDPTQLKDRRLLVCFFDMQQRPARNCVEELVKRTAWLKEQGVTVLAVHEKGVDLDTLRTWARESGVAFPVGIIASDPDEVRLAWSVRSLPWLVLTDRGHIVRAEGFTVGELADRTKEADE